MKYILKLNYFLIVPVIFIYSLGLFTLFSLNKEDAKTHLLYFIFGLGLYLVFTYLDYKVLKYFSYYFYIFSIILLCITKFLGITRLGASRWLNIGLVTFQPSELVKIFLLIFTSYYIETHPQILKSIFHLVKFILFIIPVVLLVFIQPDLGTTLIILLSIIGTLFYMGLNKYYLVFAFILFGFLSNFSWGILKDYQRQRILTFVNPQLDILGSGYNVEQSIIAVGSGGFLGKGFSKGTQSHLSFLPSATTDFIFATYAEEAGFLGCTLFIVSYMFLLFGILYSSYKCNEIFGKALGIGIFFMFSFQFIINVGMSIGLVPVTGIPLMLMSYGGSSLFVSMMSLGIAQSIWINNKV